MQENDHFLREAVLTNGITFNGFDEQNDAKCNVGYDQGSQQHIVVYGVEYVLVLNREEKK